MPTRPGWVAGAPSCIPRGSVPHAALHCHPRRAQMVLLLTSGVLFQCFCLSLRTIHFLLYAHNGVGVCPDPTRRIPLTAACARETIHRLAQPPACAARGASSALWGDDLSFAQMWHSVLAQMWVGVGPWALLRMRHRRGGVDCGADSATHRYRCSMRLARWRKTHRTSSS